MNRTASSARRQGNPLGWRRAGAIFCAFAALGFSSAPAALTLSTAETMKIGRKIWQNECGGTIAGLTSWNSGEDFASLGIGHFIWYPQGRRGPFEESFPKFLAFAKRRGAQLPAGLSPGNPCPWSSRAEFLAAAASDRLIELRQFLAKTIHLQAEFLVLRLEGASAQMAQAASAAARPRVGKNFVRLEASAQGCYALIDYVNFKGEGVLPTERYAGRGWGLRQVLEGMSEHGAATAAFADSAATVLRERVQNAPPERHEARWLPGWLNRVATYR